MIKKFLLITIMALIIIPTTSCKNAGYKNGGLDNSGYEIIYRKIKDKEVETIEKQQVFLNYASGWITQGIDKCQVVAEIKITDIETIAYRRKESKFKRDIYFSVLTGEVLNVYKGEDSVSKGESIRIETDDSLVYLGDLKFYLEEGSSYYMFLIDRETSWKNKLVDYFLYFETSSYEYMLSMMNTGDQE